MRADIAAAMIEVVVVEKGYLERKMSEGWLAEVVACLVRSRGEIEIFAMLLAGRPPGPKYNQSSNVTPIIF